VLRDHAFSQVTFNTRARNLIIPQISVYDVVVGDIVLLESGNVIPADGLYVNGYSILVLLKYWWNTLDFQDMKVDESPMTGESENVHHDEGNPYFLSSCKVTIFSLIAND
jgi:P-type Ca2+ transporter type 2C